ncbi:phosphoribosyltransferase [Acuticoccus sp. I52.16.1]|uniref:phosphoribosyltransferase n=1 Tax=Acuticoccus sp. I52.16.1 TaxID=2928472 RepID=UPI001FD353EB|nr:phosphoribosyltransferase [Acuticoccus sp. I52.16.1]UOM33014.1 phosphoribosyltransferase [Acuticoccus sp. I52.16.1]
MSAPSVLPHEVWQTLYPPGTFAVGAGVEFDTVYPATLPDGRQIALPIRALPDSGGSRAVASLIIHQAAFAVEDALADVMAERLAPFAPDVVVSVPSLGLTLGQAVARRLGHSRLVALGTTRKFWYDMELSEPSSSISSARAPKMLYLDPRMRPLLEGRRIALVDDVVSTGSSLGSVLRLLAKAEVTPCALAVAMTQTDRWRALPELAAAGLGDRVVSAFATPPLVRTPSGLWRAETSVHGQDALPAAPAG